MHVGNKIVLYTFVYTRRTKEASFVSAVLTDNILLFDKCGVLYYLRDPANGEIEQKKL